jgi:hypothetical protein
MIPLNDTAAQSSLRRSYVGCRAVFEMEDNESFIFHHKDLCNDCRPETRRDSPHTHIYTHKHNTVKLHELQDVIRMRLPTNIQLS